MEIKSVQHYIQKKELFNHFMDYLEEYQNIILLVDSFIYEKHQNKFDCLPETVSILFESQPCVGDCVVGIGGGKIMDQAKKFAYDLNCDCVLLPTSLATDAPCTDITVVDDTYIECGCPKMVLVDETILIQAPTRFFINGIGDAISTYYEAKHSNMPTSIQVLCNACLNTILTHGKQAIDDQKEGLITDSFSKCVEAILYMSGTVYANTKGNLTHGLTSGFTKFCENKMHGEIVSFFLLVQLCIENNEQIHDIRDFFKQIGLPCHLKEIGLKDAEDEDFEYIISTCPSEMMNKFPMILNSEDIIEAMRVVDAFE